MQEIFFISPDFFDESIDKLERFGYNKYAKSIENT